MNRKGILFTAIILIFFSSFLISSTSNRQHWVLKKQLMHPIPPWHGFIPGTETMTRAERCGESFIEWLDENVGELAPEVAVGVVMGDKLVFHYGVNADKDTTFGLASLTKTFTAVLTLHLVEVGKLSLEDAVTKYLPGVVIERKELKSEPVTIGHLLSHTSGMPSYGKDYVSHNINGKEFRLLRQIHPTGYCYSYSNDGYVLMKHIIEASTGISYGRLIQERILDPLGMTSSSGYYSNGTGGIKTTIEDLARYTSMLINKGSYDGKVIISENSYNKMLAQQVELPSTRTNYYYSLSWEVITVNNKIDSFYKAGRWPNESSGMQVFPKKKIAFIYLCNPPEHRDSAFMSWRSELTSSLRGLVQSIASDYRLCSSWPRLTAEQLKWYVGEYENIITGERVTIFMKDDILHSTMPGFAAPLRTFTSNRLLISNGRMLHNFVWKDNRVIGLALRDGYYKLVR